MQPIISIENLGKKYRILKGAKGSHVNPEPPGLFKRGAKLVREDFWALRDFSLDIMPGDSVGIIGRNGAGKSTLLKLLSRITEPTTGKITMRGRVASLLEVGTGFHPELTGRENIFLNGAILGMTRKEIRRKFDEIIDFAGVEEFLDVPVKRYSSGMYVRLGFAVAAHLEPEILVVDEVLAVGDAEFQKKCLGKMEEVSTGQGRTVLFVSHNMGMVGKLCRKGAVLQNGMLAVQGAIEIALAHYRSLSLADIDLRERTDREGNGDIRFTAVRLLDGRTSTPVYSAQTGAPLVIELHYEKSARSPKKKYQISFVINSAVSGNDLFVCATSYSTGGVYLNGVSGAIRCRVDKWPLGEGKYTIRLFAQSAMGIADWIHEAAVIATEAGDYLGRGAEAYATQDRLMIPHAWIVE